LCSTLAWLGSGVPLTTNEVPKIKANMYLSSHSTKGFGCLYSEVLGVRTLPPRGYAKDVQEMPHEKNERSRHALSVVKVLPSTKNETVNLNHPGGSYTYQRNSGCSKFEDRVCSVNGASMAKISDSGTLLGCPLQGSLSALRQVQVQLHVMTGATTTANVLASQIELYDVLLVEISGIRYRLAEDLQRTREALRMN
jgi:hypothetical protein